MNNDFKIKKAEKSDAFELENISKASLTDFWSEKSFESELKNKHSLTLVGFLNKSAISYITGQFFDFFNINSLAVLSKYRRQGIGKKLLNEVVLFCKDNDIEKLCIEVRKSNYYAIKFYEKNGFKKVGIRKNFYSNPIEDAILMNKIIER